MASYSMTMSLEATCTNIGIKFVVNKYNICMYIENTGIHSNINNAENLSL